MSKCRLCNCSLSCTGSHSREEAGNGSLPTCVRHPMLRAQSSATAHRSWAKPTINDLLTMDMRPQAGTRHQYSLI